MNAASRALRLSLAETSEVLLAASQALDHMRTVARLADDLRSARDNADALERTLDLEARASGRDATWLMDPEAQSADVNTWEAVRDRFTAAHGPTAIVASGSRAMADRVLRISDLIAEQDALWTAPITTWLWAGSTPPRPTGRIVQVLALLPRAATNVAAHIARIRQVGQALQFAEECQRIANGLEDSHERFSNAMALKSARAEEHRLADAVAAAVKEAATPAQRSDRPTPYAGATRANSRTQRPAAEPAVLLTPKHQQGSGAPAL